MSNQAQILQRVGLMIAEGRSVAAEMDKFDTGQPVPDNVRRFRHWLESLTEAVELLARLATEPLSDEEALTLVPGSRPPSSPPVLNESFTTLAQQLLAEIGEEGTPDASFEAMVERAIETLKARRIENGQLRQQLAKLQSEDAPPAAPPAAVATFDWDLSFVGSL